MKIHAISCAGPHSTRKYEQVRELFRTSAPRLHDWTDDPAAADIIFLTDAPVAAEPVITRHAYPRKYAEKCFILSEQWEPPFLLAGIYANAPRAPFWRGRFRTASYALHHPDFRNRFIEQHEPAHTAVRQPDLLGSFLGRDCHPVRRRMFAQPKRADLLIEDTSHYNAFVHEAEGRVDRQRHYYEICLRSKFILCPRGAGPNSIRLFEALKLGIAPVIIADAWVPCEGPRWSEFAIFVAEKDIDQLAGVLEREEPTWRDRGRLAREAYEDFFSPTAYFNYLVAAAASARAARIVPERWFVSLWPVQRFFRRAQRRGLRLIGAH